MTIPSGDDRTCQQCKPWAGAWSDNPGECSECGRLFDKFGDALEDEVCWRCDRQPDVAVRPTRTPGWCSRCGFFFDDHGMRLLDPAIRCKVHNPINASCPHSGSLNPVD